MNPWIELITVIVEVFLPWYFFSGMLGKSRRSGLLKICVVSAYAAALAALSLFVPPLPVRSFVIMALTYFAALVYFGQGWLSTLYPTVLFFLFSMLADILCGVLLLHSSVAANAIMGGGIERLIYNVLCKLVHLLCLYIILAVSRARANSYSILKALPLLSCQLLSIYICQRNYLLIIFGNGPDFLSFETFGLLYINLIICAFVETLNRSHKREREAEAARQQLELQKNYYLDMMERQEETRTLWHDIKKYMATMETLAAATESKEANAYLEQLKSAFSGIDNVFDTGNKLIDSILTYAMKKARDAGVALRPEIWVNCELSFPAADLFVIMGNTLDNAIEACCQLEDSKSRIITVLLRQQNHVLLYEISNPYNASAPQKSGNIHGYGLKNVSACVERNNSSILITKSNGVFTVTAHLNLDDK